MRKKIAIIGAGITGLVTALHLKERGYGIRLYEKKEYAGGAIRTHKTNGWLVETGPNTLTARSDLFWKLVEKLDLESQADVANLEAKKRYIIRDGKPVALPASPLGLLTTGLWSNKAKLRLLKEPFIKPSGKEESIAEFTARRLGKEILDYGINPFVGGIYAGNPEQLSIKHTFTKLYELEQQHGSLLKGGIKQFFSRHSRTTAHRKLISFKEGLGTLTNAIARSLGNSLHLETPVVSLERSSGGWLIGFEGRSSERFDAVILTIPAHSLPHLEIQLDPPGSLEVLTDIRYPPLSVVALGYRREKIGHALDGFGMLVPEKEPFRLLGTLFSSTLFPGRAPEHHALLTSFIGGARRPELASRPRKTLIEQTHHELKTLLDITEEPVFVRHCFWPHAIPQYEKGYDHFLSHMDRLEKTNPGLFLAGNFRGGISVPDCIESGYETARKAELFLQS